MTTCYSFYCGPFNPFTMSNNENIINSNISNDVPVDASASTEANKTDANKTIIMKKNMVPIYIVSILGLDISANIVGNFYDAMSKTPSFVSFMNKNETFMKILGITFIASMGFHIYYYMIKKLNEPTLQLKVDADYNNDRTNTKQYYREFYELKTYLYAIPVGILHSSLITPIKCLVNGLSYIISYEM